MISKISINLMKIFMLKFELKIKKLKKKKQLNNK